MFKLWGRRELPPGFTGIGLHPDGVSVVSTEARAGAKPVVTAWDFRPVKSAADYGSALSALAAEYDLSKAHCTTYLDPSDYRLLLLEGPALPPDELAEAMRWRIKDVVDFDVSDAVVDVFAVPTVENKRENQPVYVVVARNDALQQRIALLEKAHINLEVIDIPELALRNIASLYSNGDRGVALLGLGNDYGVMTVTQHNVLYLSRALNVGLSELLKAKERGVYLDRIVLEVQRSFDYYVSSLRQAPVDKLLLAPLPDGFPGLDRFFADRLGIPVVQIHLHELVTWQKNIPESMEARCVTTFGAALRAVN